MRATDGIGCVVIRIQTPVAQVLVANAFRLSATASSLTGPMVNAGAARRGHHRTAKRWPICGHRKVSPANISKDPRDQAALPSHASPDSADWRIAKCAVADDDPDCHGFSCQHRLTCARGLGSRRPVAPDVFEDRRGPQDQPRRWRHCRGCRHRCGQHP